MTRTEWAVWTVFAAALTFTISYAVAITSARVNEFSAECVARDGKPVYNGREQVCLR